MAPHLLQQCVSIFPLFVLPDKASNKASATSRRLLCVADVSMVVDGLLYLPSVRRLPFGGRDVTKHLRRLLAARGIVIDDLSALQVRLIAPGQVVPYMLYYCALLSP